MTAKKTVKWIVLSLFVVLAAAAGAAAWAADPDGEGDAVQTAAEPAGSGGAGAGVLAPEPSSAPRMPNPRIAMDADLVGTVVVEGGRSLAVFQLASETWMVREGDEIASGVRLVRIGRDRIEVEREGVQEEIRLGSSQGSRHQFRPGSIRGPVTQADVERLWEFRRQKVNDLLGWVARHRG